MMANSPVELFGYTPDTAKKTIFHVHNDGIGLACLRLGRVIRIRCFIRETAGFTRRFRAA
ncbi:hypothetical protein [Rhizobium aethiopicum]|uniref:hypothetical protein n=1 Tax=Rhizobium aethiopicum TaxID=1138170 RepID=UPI001ABFFCD3|nr:hypothetical protein [Rhizobium aethiopicum]